MDIAEVKRTVSQAIEQDPRSFAKDRNSPGVTAAVLDRIKSWAEDPGEGPFEFNREARQNYRKLARPFVRVAMRTGLHSRALLEASGLWAAIPDDLRPSVEEAVLEEEGRVPKAPVTINLGIVEWNGLTPLYEEVGERIARCVSPEAEFVTLQASRSLAEFWGTHGFNMVVGLFHSVRRLAQGLQFVRLPGWKPRIHVVQITRSRSEPAKIEDPARIFLEKQAGLPTLTIDQEAGYEFLVGPAGLDKKDVDAFKVPDSDDVGAMVGQIVEKMGDFESALFCADELWCRNVVDHLQSSDELAFEATLVEGVDWPEEEVGIYLFHDADRKVVEVALQEIFDTATPIVAQLYARAILAASRDNDLTRGRYMKPGETLCPYFFELSTPSLTERFWNEVYACLEREAKDKVRDLRPNGERAPGAYPLSDGKHQYIWGKGIYGDEPRDAHSKLVSLGSRGVAVIPPARPARWGGRPPWDWSYDPPARLGLDLYVDRQEASIGPPLSTKEVMALRGEYERQTSNCYPTLKIRDALREELARRHSLLMPDPQSRGGDRKPSMDHILLGNGLMELLAKAYSYNALLQRSVVVPAPSFWPAYSYAVQRGLTLLMPKYEKRQTEGERFTFDLKPERLEAALSTNPGICYLSVPDNPLGVVLDAEYFRGLVRNHPECLFFVDGAYMAYVEEKGWGRWSNVCTELLQDGVTNVVCGYTFSKEYALANHRVGYLIGDPETLRCIEALGGPYGMSEMSLAMAYFNLREGGYAEANVAAVKQHKQQYESLLMKLSIPYCHCEHNAVILLGAEYQGMFESQRIAVRPLTYEADIPNPVPEGVRITIPTDAESFRVLCDATERLAGLQNAS